MSTSPPISIVFDSTPNPRSRKLIADRLLRKGTPVTYRKTAGAFEAGPMIKALLSIDHITDLYIRDNVLTITQDGSGSWYLLEDLITHAIRDNIGGYDPSYTPPAQQTESASMANRPAVKPSPQMDIMRQILDATITPYINSHGGSIELIEFNPEAHQLFLFYEGTCGTCPSSLGMTLSAIQNMLRDQFDPEITVTVVNPFPE